MLNTFLLKKNSGIAHKNFLNYKMSYFLNNKSYTIFFDAFSNFRCIKQEVFPLYKKEN